MKIIYTILFISALATLIGCGPKKTKDPIINHWILEKVELSKSNENDFSLAEITAATANLAEITKELKGQMSFEFNEDGSTTASAPNMMNKSEMIHSKGKWMIDQASNSIVLDIEGGSEKYAIKLITEDSLLLELDKMEMLFLPKK